MATTVRRRLTLFSTVTTLAYWVGERFHGHRHYVWAAAAPATGRFVPENLPSSDPVRIYWPYHRDIAAGDEHSAVIEANRRGIVRGAREQCDQGAVDEATTHLIEATASRAPLADFRPLLLAILWPVRPGYGEAD